VCISLTQNNGVTQNNLLNLDSLKMKVLYKIFCTHVKNEDYNLHS